MLLPVKAIYKNPSCVHIFWEYQVICLIILDKPGYIYAIIQYRIYNIHLMV